jgi:hypothetical protein
MEIIEHTPKLRHIMLPLLGLILSTGLMVASLWQIEIAVSLPNEHFDFPFYIYKVNKWWIRDFWYLINMISWLLGIISTAFLINQHNHNYP